MIKMDKVVEILQANQFHEPIPLSVSTMLASLDDIDDSTPIRFDFGHCVPLLAVDWEGEPGMSYTRNLKRTVADFRELCEQFTVRDRAIRLVDDMEFTDTALTGFFAIVNHNARVEEVIITTAFLRSSDA